MKYMGSKRAMLKNGLGHLIDYEVKKSKRFVDLFTGSGAVASFAAQKHKIPVLAVDLQSYSAILAGSIIERDAMIVPEAFWKSWAERAAIAVKAEKFPKSESITQKVVKYYRDWCAQRDNLPITQAYGGHYFSPEQAVWLDALRRTMPKHQPARDVALAALIRAASQCAAAPGHTAQPFQPTRSAKQFLVDAWSRDILLKTKHIFSNLALAHAQVAGSAHVADANSFARNLKDGDLVFIDPPYSGVHYSRFYHVLETVSKGRCGPVDGTGRYPDSDKRPKSLYSLKQDSEDALDDLLGMVSSKGASAILTFPEHDCSNGLSGEIVQDIAETHFKVQKRLVKSTFSTLGGTGINEDESGRNARHNTHELILVLRPA